VIVAVNGLPPGINPTTKYAALYITQHRYYWPFKSVKRTHSLIFIRRRGKSTVSVRRKSRCRAATYFQTV